MIKLIGLEINVFVRLKMYSSTRCSCDFVNSILLYLILSSHHLYIYQILDPLNNQP